MFEEYRYDALGRRVMVRARPLESQCTSGADNCIANTVYTMWDGDQLLTETRASSVYGQQIVPYTHGPGIDAPLAVRLSQGGTTRDIIPISNWRGLYDGGVFADGRTVQNGMDLKAIEWPAANYRAFFDYIPPSDGRTQVWLGSLMSHKRDASGQLYMRNRYFDPSSGRFTQEDPIGLAGGLNLYGFGGGDPMTYSDPYGLCPAEAAAQDTTRALTKPEADRVRCIAQTRLADGPRNSFVRMLDAGLVRVGPVRNGGAWAQTDWKSITILDGTILRIGEVSIGLTIAHELRHIGQRSSPLTRDLANRGHMS